MRCFQAMTSWSIDRPSNAISPDVGSINPTIIFIVVDLPDPLGPR